MASSRVTRSDLTAACRAWISREDGFGLVELIVASMVVLTGVLTVFVAFEASQRGDRRGEHNASVAHRSQSELERILALPYASVGMESIPSNDGSGNPKDPLNYVVDSLPGYEYDWSETKKQEKFVNGGALATSNSWTEENQSGTLYRFITWASDQCPACAHSQDYKRVTLVLTTPGNAAPFITSTIITK